MDGTYAGGADTVDIDGAVGATLLDSTTVSAGVLAAGVMMTDLTGTLDISGSDGSELYLRLENVLGTTGEPWTAVDNISIVPEPASLALLGLGGLVMFGRRG